MVKEVKKKKYCERAHNNNNHDVRNRWTRAEKMCVLVFEENARHKYQAGHQQLFKKYEDKNILDIACKSTKRKTVLHLKSTVQLKTLV